MLQTKSLLDSPAPAPHTVTKQTCGGVCRRWNVSQALSVFIFILTTVDSSNSVPASAPDLERLQKWLWRDCLTASAALFPFQCLRHVACCCGHILSRQFLQMPSTEAEYNISAWNPIYGLCAQGVQQLYVQMPGAVWADGGCVHLQSTSTPLNRGRILNTQMSVTLWKVRTVVCICYGSSSCDHTAVMRLFEA